MAAAEQLYFQVVIIAQTLFNENPCITKLSFGIVLHLAVDPSEMFNFSHLFDTHTAASGSSLHKYGWIFDVLTLLVIQQLVGNFFSLHFIIYRAVSSWYDRDCKRFSHLLGVDFVTEVFDDLPVRADEG